ncbi:DUF6436 domain-containing protein [Stenotrophomonas sp. 24(2023)]|uniref:DUF6436 domain-containing protein n=1 Tax=Stenotrophomonas sp. 24(2023) TaxID=3068324 RepID=UPI0027E1FBEA|nr:DUF6436 domain-containing protein [Stenotrophomonas sp. 24(2023)]WMJ70859.1 DUF6436 domain-containing protein [Stenotrophomonas sp. 24(2023)]
MKPRRRALRWGIALGCLFMAGTGVALWNYFGYGAQARFSEQAIVFDDTQLRLPAALAGATGRIRVVHFWDPACTVCNRETGAHLSYLISMYRRANVDFYAVRRPGTQGELPAHLRGRLTELPTLAGIEHIPASPAVAIWDGSGHLAYAGPYSIGMVCNSANSFVEPILDKLVAGQTVRPRGLLAVGCYCPWHDAR